MLRSVERRRGASDENELFGCWLSFAADVKQIGTFEKEEEPAERIDDGGERADEMKNRKQTRSPSRSRNSLAEDLWYNTLIPRVAADSC